jgi:cytochrome c551/c552
MAYVHTRDVDASGVLRLGLRARLRAARAARIASEHSRRRLAARLEKAVARAERGDTPFSAAVPVCHAAAAGEARSALLDLAERLRGPRRVEPDGVRLVRRLLVDGAGPLYVPAEPGELRAAALEALRALDAHGAGG